MLIVLYSGTSAQRLKRILASINIPSEIIQTPKSISEGGCTYSIRVKSEHADKILPHLKESRINVKGIFEELKGSYIPYTEKFL